jgi:hypothetical protein
VLGFRLGRGDKAVRGPDRRWPAMALALAVGAGLLGAASSAVQASASRPAEQPAAVTQSSGMMNQILPRRILDTRTTTGGHHSKLGSGATMQLAVLNGGGVPAAGVSAVLVNVTAVNETAGTGYLTLFPTGATRPTVSTLNYRAGISVANQALVRVGTDGTVSIFNNAGQTDVIVDIVGWVGIDSAAANGQTTTATPTRILDTRTTTGGHDAPLLSNKSLTLQVEGAGGIPATGVSAVYANITAVPVGNSGGYLTAYPSGAPAPSSSNVNFPNGVTAATLQLLPVSATGAITITNHSPGVNVLVDVGGWVSGGDVTADAGTQAITGTRILDTRTTLGGHDGVVGSNSSVSVGVLGVAGVPATGVAAVIVHVTGLTPTAGTYLTAYATGYPTPSTSTLNIPKGTMLSTTTIVPVGPAGKVTIYNEQGSLNVLVDVQGWVAAPVLTVTPPAAASLGLSDSAPLTSTDGAQATTILTNANRYAVTTWWKNVAPALLGAPMKSEISPNDVQALTVTGPSASNAPAATTTVNTGDAVRRLSMEAFSLATSIATGEYNQAYTQAPASVGNVSTATATQDAVKIISTIAAHHLTVTPVSSTTGWGASTESQLDSAYIGTAAWLLWPDLTATTQSEVVKMVYFEAAWGMGIPLQFYASESGTILQPGDTGADPDSWDPMPVQLALVMFPTSAMAPVWENTVVRDALVAWAQPSDDTNSTMVNGETVASWIDGRGSNVLSGGNLYNHNRYAPDYSTLTYQNMQEVLLTSLAGSAAPDASTALVAPVYNAYTTVTYPSSDPWKPSYDSAGGKVYPALSANSATVYYPEGCDWGTGQEIPYALVDAQAEAFVSGASTSAASYESLHAGAELKMQQANADGSTYSEYPSNDTSEYVYVGREEHTAQLAAQLYLTEYIRDHSLSSFTSTSYVLAP